MPLDLPTSDPQLRRAYLHWNRLYFGGELPEDVVLWFEPVAGGVAEMDCGRMPHEPLQSPTVCQERLWLRRGEGGEWYVIIDPSARYRRCRWGMDLFHEMAHIKLDPYDGHGARFQKEMQRLAGLGAFVNLW